MTVSRQFVHNFYMESRPGFRPEYLDFHRGIHVGNLEDSQRITRILKLALESRYGQSFVTERWGRGVYWRWIGFLARANRDAKPLSSQYSFGCSKFFLSVEAEEQLCKCGLQVERGYLKAPRGSGGWQLKPDWDWNRLLQALRRGGPMEKQLARLGRDGFTVSPECGPGAGNLRRALQAAPANQWAGFQLYFPLTEADVSAATGADLVDSMLAVFEELVPVMNLCSQVVVAPARR